MRTLSAALAVALVLITAPAFGAIAWTGSGGAGVPDEATIGIYDSNTGSTTYNATGSTSPIVLRYVLNDTSATGTPGWTTIALDAYDPDTNGFVRVQFFRLTPGGTNNMFASCTSNDAAVFTTTLCTMPTVNFNSGDSYTAVVTISRTTTSSAPILRAVRLY